MLQLVRKKTGEQTPVNKVFAAQGQINTEVEINAPNLELYYSSNALASDLYGGTCERGCTKSIKRCCARRNNNPRSRLCRIRYMRHVPL